MGNHLKHSLVKHSLAAVRKRAYRARMRAEGYVLKQIWVRPERWEQLRKVIKQALKPKGGYGAKSRKARKGISAGR